MSEKAIKQYLSNNGKKGGGTTLKRHGKDHFKKISKIALAKRWGKQSSESTQATQSTQ